MGAVETHSPGTPDPSTFTVPPPHISLFRKIINIIGCLVCLPLYASVAVHCRWPVTLDLVLTVALAELNRFVNEGRRIAFYESEKQPVYRDKDDDFPHYSASEKNKWLAPATVKSKVVDLEKAAMSPSQSIAPPRLDCLAAVVGWREDPGLFTRALESYRMAKGCAFLLVGIDGDEEPDQDMVDVFHKVYPNRSRTVHVSEPLGEIAHAIRAKELALRQRTNQPFDPSECDAIALNHCIQLARTILSQADITFSGPDAVSQLCIRQRHMHKKGIMFTSYIFALVIADTLGLEFLWSSDSDTLVSRESLLRTVDAMAVDATIGGASSGLVVHNGGESVVTRLAETVYWGELYLTRSTPAASATSDCQSGPSTIFRIGALPPILVPWYVQTIFGKRMIINEDRHLTTNLLKRGWKVVYASDVLTSTDTPTTLARWLKQQVRWARATHIESLLEPKVYPMSHPLLFFSMWKRELGPVIAACAIVAYFLTGTQPIYVSGRDVLARMLLAAAYNVLRNPHRLPARSMRWILPGMVFYHIPLPAVHVWSMLTLTADGWGTSMRASGERAKRDGVRQAWFETGFFVVWMGVVAGVVARIVVGVYGMRVDGGVGGVLFVGSVLVASFLGWKGTIQKIS